MKKLFFFGFAFIILSTNLKAQYWSWVLPNQIQSTGKQVIVPKVFQAARLQSQDFKNLLFSAPHEKKIAIKNSPLIIELPMPDKTMARFKVVEYNAMGEKLSAAYQNIKTFSVIGIDDPFASGKLDWNEFGFHAMIRSPRGDVFIDPYFNKPSDYYLIYYKSDFEKPDEYRMKEESLLPGDENNSNLLTIQNTMASCMGAQLRTYRLAVACTYEYASAATGTSTPTKAQVLSKVVTSVNRVNGVYETELAVRLVLIDNDTLILYNTPSDPFSGNNNSSILIGESQSVITSVIGTANFDIGHTFSTGGGGLANLGCVCKSTSKASGITGSPNPVGDPYDIDYVAHEMGHQFGANHTFTSNTGSCSGNQNPSTSQEPGSGVTIMGYAGICGSDNIANNSIAYFHPVSYTEIVNYITVGSGKNCPVVTATGNNPPTVMVSPTVYTVPLKTPFILKGSATDPDGDALTFSWEETDNGPASGAAWNSGNKPFFRSYVPTPDSTRMLPKLSSTLMGSFNLKGEFFPSTNQTLNFKLTARDNKPGGGGICAASTQVLVDASVGPFAITSPNTSGIVYPSGSVQTLSWSVNGTDGSPINVSTINIYISLDNGNTFQPLVMNTPNDGTEDVTLPTVASDVSTCRFKIEGVNHIIFDINDKAFKITALTTAFSPISNQNNLGILAQPNPFKQSLSLTVEGLNPLQVTEVLLYDILGKEVWLKRYDKTDAILDNLSIDNLPSGVYFIKVHNANKQAVYRIVKE
jgi:hypothetical protein